ncbi:hypothetical protein KJ068_04905 [bacterium]|nr:hypothetical protein [bacterium]RIK72655.1 MAG: hypothetical protein DCC62_19100 [candidate division KSB1 bacterium]
MFLSYDSEGDVLEVVFDESLHQAEQSAYQLRDGIIVYVAARSNKPVQLTLVSYRELARIHAIHFDGWQKLTAAARKRLFPIISSPPLSNFFKFDPKTGYGTIIFPTMPEILAIAA